MGRDIVSGPKPPSPWGLTFLVCVPSSSFSPYPIVWFCVCGYDCRIGKEKHIETNHKK